MQKVYADKKYKYFTEQREFVVPVELKNDPILADAEFYKALSSGDAPTDDNGNLLPEDEGQAFFDEEPTEQQAPTDPIIDTVKSLAPRGTLLPKKDEKNPSNSPEKPNSPALTPDKKKLMPKKEENDFGG